MSDLSSLAPIIRREVAEERARSFAEAKEKDTRNIIRPEAEVRKGLMFGKFSLRLLRPTPALAVVHVATLLPERAW